MVDFLVAKLPDNFSPRNTGLKFVTETSPHSSHRSSQEAKKFVTWCSLWGQSHVRMGFMCRKALRNVEKVHNPS